ncbi:MAG: hypothetical protein JNM00_02970, partial [Flavobacteriales bacterium]|nr:hypothetical protein [Flavobacteriales bacterium]
MKSNSSFLYLTIAVICFSLQLHSQSPGGVSSGLVLWLKANAGTNTVSENSPVSSWLDQSPMGNHATQGDPASQPVFTKFAINNNPAVKFTSGTKFLNVDLSDIDNQNFTMYVVAERLSAGSADNFVVGVQQTSPDPGMHMGYSSANTFVFGQYGHTCSTTVTPFNAPTEVPVIMMAEFSQSAGSALREVEDGTTASDTDGNTSSYAQNAQGVIGRGYASAGFDGYIAEVIAFNRILTTAEKKNVETYLAVKYGLTIALGDHDYFAEPGFQWDVAGIGMNSVTQGLNQPKSASESRNEILTISSPASMTNGEYLIWGNDDRPISFVPGDPSDCNLSQVLDRCWMAKETGDVGTVKLEFNLSGFPSVNPNDVMLYIDLDGDGFGDENPIAGTYSNPIKTFAGVNLNNNRFTIGIGASVYYSVASGNTDSAIWSKTPNGVPVMATFCDKTNFIIQNGHTVTNTVAMMETKDFTINSGATFNAGNNTVSVSGNFSVSGTYNCDNGTVRFEGNNAQFISGTSNLIMNHITCDGSGGVSISSPSVRLKGVLLINAGNFNTNNKLTLQSDANQTGSIGPIAGNLTGTVVVERYYQAASAGWVNICAPIQNKTILDWNDDLITTGFPGSDYPNYPFNNIQRYIESVAGNQDQGYTGTVDVTQQLVNKAGYMAYMNAGLMQLDISGTIFKGVQTLPVSFTNTGNANGDGWNLVANPYPSAINWDQASGWTKTNINNAVYVWDADNQQYASYVNGVSNNGGSPVIPSSQSFWVV